MKQNCIYLEDESVELLGYTIYGAPWAAKDPAISAWAFLINRGSPELKEKWAAIPDKVDILLTHGPPLGHGDLSRLPGWAVPGDPELSEDGYAEIRTGCYDLLKRVEDVKPLYHIFGHIHEGI